MSNYIVKLKRISTKNHYILSHLLTAFNAFKIPYSNYVIYSCKYNCILNLDKLSYYKLCVKASYSCNSYSLLIVIGK